MTTLGLWQQLGIKAPVRLIKLGGDALLLILPWLSLGTGALLVYQASSDYQMALLAAQVVQLGSYLAYYLLAKRYGLPRIYSFVLPVLTLVCLGNYALAAESSFRWVTLLPLLMSIPVFACYRMMLVLHLVVFAMAFSADQLLGNPWVDRELVIYASLWFLVWAMGDQIQRTYRTIAKVHDKVKDIEEGSAEQEDVDSAKNTLQAIFRNVFYGAATFLIMMAIVFNIQEKYFRDLEAKHQQQEDKLASRIQEAKQNIVLALERVNVTMHVLRSSLEQSPGEVRAFLDLAPTLYLQYPGMKALMWIPEVRDDQRSQMEAALPQARVSPLTFFDRVGDHSKVSPYRSVLYPIYYLYPLGANRPLLGFDLASNPQRKLELERAKIHSGAVIYSEPMDILTGQEPWIMATTWLNSSGFAGGLFSMHDLLATTDMIRLTEDIRIRLRDRGQTLFDSGEGEGWTQTHSYVAIPFGKRDWYMEVASLKTESAQDFMIWMVLGVILTNLMGWFFYQMMGERFRLRYSIQIQTYELEFVNREALAASEAKSRFLANMSHEIRTPLNGIIGLTEVLIEENKDRRITKDLETIGRSSNLLKGLVNDLLDYSKIEAGKLQVSPIAFNLLSMLDDVVALLDFSASGNNVTFEHRFAEDLPTFVRGDEVRLRQILINFLSNAMKFGRDGTVTFVVNVSDDDQIEFSISDTGIGMSPEQLSRLYNAFEQADDSTTRKYGGTGLGMAISKQLAELMEGRIEVWSELGLGSTFRLYVPLPEMQQVVQTTLDLETEQLLLASVLVVEDNKVNQMVISRMLSRYAERVELAGNGQEAVDMLVDSNKRYSLVLMDMQMPLMGGIEACLEIRKTISPDQQPILAFTANASTKDQRECVEAGMQGFVTKPIRREELIRALAPYNEINHLKSAN